MPIAFRHALWSASITSEYGKDVAADITNAHEGIKTGEHSQIDFSKAFSGDMNLADNIVDLLNNEVGQSIGEKNSGQDSKSLANAVINVFQNEGLWTATSNEDGSITISRTKISSDQADAARKRVSGLDGNGMSPADRDSLKKDEE
jgi:hypothetical protein